MIYNKRTDQVTKIALIRQNAHCYDVRMEITKRR